jgi:hypothetical protein
VAAGWGVFYHLPAVDKVDILLKRLGGAEARPPMMVTLQLPGGERAYRGVEFEERQPADAVVEDGDLGLI